MKRALTITLLLTGAFFFTSAQDKKTDKAVFKEYAPNTFMKMILMDNSKVEEAQQPEEKDRIFFMDQSKYDLPRKLTQYKMQWHNPTISQGRAGTCWCFSTTSFYESEVYRLTGKKLKISELHTVYWEYVEKAREYVRTRGKSNFSEGSEANAVTRIYKKYGAVPADTYTGLLHGKKYHDHSDMVDEMTGYLQSIKKTNSWNEEEVLSTIMEILNHYIGKPPAEFTLNGKSYTPKSFLSEYLSINPDDYVEVLSYMQEPYYQMVEYKVPDNWWHSKDYFNVPLNDYMSALNQAIENGYTVSIGGDVSEAGFVRSTNCAMIPDFDIPSGYISEEARQFRFSNGTTTDDHGMHLVGYTDHNGKRWFLIKDSSSGSRQIDESDPAFGFYFFHEDYVRLKMMGFTVHKDAVKDLLQKRK